jgi:hypothetical protein
MRRGSMRNVSPRGFASPLEIGVARRPNQKRSDLLNPLFQKSLPPQGFAASERLASVDATLFLPRPSCSQIPLGPVRALTDLSR